MVYIRIRSLHLRHINRRAPFGLVSLKTSALSTATAERSPAKPKQHNPD